MNAYYRAKSDPRFVFHADHAASPDHFTPVVVIDPEDREQVRAIADAAWPEGFGNTNRLQAALREFANPTPDAPTKPDEPTGIGAVVRDDEGDYWQRSHANGNYPWMRILRPTGEDYTKSITDRYEHITAVEVVFEGVNP